MHAMYQCPSYGGPGQSARKMRQAAQKSLVPGGRWADWRREWAGEVVLAVGKVDSVAAGRRAADVIPTKVGIASAPLFRHPDGSRDRHCTALSSSRRKSGSQSCTLPECGPDVRRDDGGCAECGPDVRRDDGGCAECGPDLRRDDGVRRCAGRAAAASPCPRPAIARSTSSPSRSPAEPAPAG